MHLVDWKNWPLAVKLTLVMTAMVVGSVLSVTLLSILRTQQAFRAELQQQSALMLNTLEAVSSDYLYRLDVDSLSDLMEALAGEEQTLASGRFYDTDGRIIADAYEEGITFSDQADPFGLQLLKSNDDVFEWQPDQLLAGRAIRVGSQRFGAVSIGLPTAPLRDKIAETTTRGVVVALVTALAGIVLSLLFSRSVTEPLHHLSHITQSIADGDLSQQIDVSGSEELVRLGQGMERMRADLQALHRDLENQVAERTRALSLTNLQLHQEIAEREQAQQALALARDEATAANHAKSAFLANMSHELRTPLTAIIGYTELLIEDLEENGHPGFIPDLERIQGSSKHLLRLINDVLDLSKIEAGRAKLDMEVFAIEPLIKQVVATIRPMAGKNGNTLLLECADNLPPMYADAMKVQQILLNLLSNAAKFTTNGEIRLMVRVDSVGDRNMFHFEITDTGIGMTPEQVNYVFEPFTQADESTTRKYGGTGLGLAISHRFCQMMGGDIMAKSRPSKGTTFTVLLPSTAVSSETATPQLQG